MKEMGGKGEIRTFKMRTYKRQSDLWYWNNCIKFHPKIYTKFKTSYKLDFETIWKIKDPYWEIFASLIDHLSLLKQVYSLK